MKALIPVTASLVLSGCCTLFHIGCDNDAAFTAIKQCAGNSLQDADSILYFGPTGLPIGTIFQAEGSGYDTMWNGTEVTGDPPSPVIVQQPQYGSCSFKGSSSIDLKAAFDVTTNPLPASGTLNADFKNAKVLSMTANAFGWETLYKGPYVAALQNSKDPLIRSDVVAHSDYAISTALLRVKGYQVSLQVDNDDTASLHAAYKDGPLSGAQKGTISGDVSFAWTSNNTLSITINDETTIAGVMRKLTQGQLQSGALAAEPFTEGLGVNKSTAQLSLHSDKPGSR